MDAVSAVIVQSLILSIMVLGVYISYKILDFPDLSADGSFALGGAVLAICLKNGLSPITGSILAVIAGLLAGLLTGIFHVKLKISNLLSGILVMGILYSINLKIMGRANIPLFNEKNLFTDVHPLIITFLLVITCKVIIDLFLQTGLGYILKGIGDNSQMIKSLGIEIGKIKILGLMLSNGLIAFSGSIMAQYQGFADISMGIGTLVLGIASIIIGTSIVKKGKIFKETTLIIIGTIIYQITIYIALNMGLPSTDLKMITSVVIVLFLAANNLKRTHKIEARWIRRFLNVKDSKFIKEFL